MGQLLTVPVRKERFNCRNPSITAGMGPQQPRQLPAPLWMRQWNDPVVDEVQLHCENFSPQEHYGVASAALMAEQWWKELQGMDRGKAPVLQYIRQVWAHLDLELRQPAFHTSESPC